MTLEVRGRTHYRTSYEEENHYRTSPIAFTRGLGGGGEEKVWWWER